MSSTLAKSLQIEDDKGKEILRKRKHIEEVASSESESDSNSDSEKMISEDEPPQHAEAELNVAAAIVDPPVDYSSQRTINLSTDDNLSQKTINAEYITPLGDSESQENVQGPQDAPVAAAMEDAPPKDVAADAAMEDAPPKDADAGAMEVDEPISVEEEALTTELTTQHITTQPVIVLALGYLAKEDDIPTDKDVQKQMDLGVSIVTEMVASGDYLDFTQPSFDLGSEFGSRSQGEPKEAEIYKIDDEEG
ncbi:hypothetical protein PIB30_086381 [Stylosanthes scabra]|uniref:Uncharacterized protein n=1 Tax=Stylosanthes scabra TaxID=79078 RepID=A0ABU6VWB7_9FABA|nr:hypothetical protein [Stylosanthes scabra]